MIRKIGFPKEILKTKDSSNIPDSTIDATYRSFIGEFAYNRIKQKERLYQERISSINTYLVILGLIIIGIHRLRGIDVLSLRLRGMISILVPKLFC